LESLSPRADPGFAGPGILKSWEEGDLLRKRIQNEY
jgi:hypothetical protein